MCSNHDAVVILNSCGGEETVQSTVLAEPQVISQVDVAVEPTSTVPEDDDEENENDLEFTTWKLQYPVMKIAPHLEVLAVETQRDRLVVLEEHVYHSWNVTVLSQNLNTPIAVRGDEYETFFFVAPQDDDDFEYWKPLEPVLVSPMRILGLSMLVVSSFCWYWITHLAKQRRMEREWDAEFQERGKGGLVTEEGLDFMLAAGRERESSLHTGTTHNNNNTITNTPSTTQGREQRSHYEEDDDEDDEDPSERRLPLPGYMNVEPATAYGFPQYAPERMDSSSYGADESSLHTSSESSHISM